LLRDEEAAGSNPATPTKNLQLMVKLVRTTWSFDEREGIAEMGWQRVCGGEGVLARLEPWRPASG
jgi:hypothetical protein